MSLSGAPEFPRFGTTSFGDARHHRNMKQPRSMSSLEVPDEFDSVKQDISEKYRGRTKPQPKPTIKPRPSQPKTRRSVHSLSTEQLARKRANDREAQRSIRQRTRERISHLENRVQQLSNQEFLQAELENLKLVNTQLEEELASLQQKARQAESSGAFGFRSSHIPYIGTHHVPSSAEASTATYSVSEISQNAFSYPDVKPTKPSHLEREWLTGKVRTTSSELQTMPSEWIPDTQIQELHHPTGHTSESTDIQSFSSGRLNRNIGQLTFQTSQTMVNVTRPPRMPRFVLYKRPNLTVFDTANPIEGILTGIIQRQSQILFEGADVHTVLGPARPDLSVIFSPKRAMAVHPLARALTHVTSLANFARNLERIALSIPHYPLLKWQIMQTYETFIDVPWFFVPTEIQNSISHHVWVDFIFWPKLREIIILNQDAYDTLEFIQLYCSSLNVNWPYSEAAAVYWDHEGLYTTDALVMHCLNLESWSVDAPFQLRYPELRSFCRFT